MRYAIVNDQRASASPGTAGSCPACGSPVNAKCGSERVHHWAHRGNKVCDHWWEPRTAWHCDWQDKFPKSWHEVVQCDEQSGERHVADVRTEHGLTLEFQYSHLRPDERAARERFYKNMVWIVSGARLRRDLPRFLEGRRSFVSVWRKGVYRTAFPDEAFPKLWLGCAAPVFFDFQNEVPTQLTRPLWCLLPRRVRNSAVVLSVSRELFVLWAHQRPHLLPTRAILQSVELELGAAEQAESARQRAAEAARRQWRIRKPYPRF